MQKEFTAGVFTASFDTIDYPKWVLKYLRYKGYQYAADIDESGSLIQLHETQLLFSDSMLTDIAYLMGRINQQYRSQLANENKDGGK